MDAGADARAAAMIHGPGMASQLPGRREGGDNLPMNRSRLAGLLAFCAVVLPHAARADEFQLVEATIADVQREMRSGRLTPEALTRMYLQRIAAYDRRLNAFAHLNEHALEAARAPGAGPLFGVPVVLKDNVDTRDMPTTAGSVALAGSMPLQDAFIAQKLRAAGAVILGKGTLTEFANFIALAMPTGYSSLLRFRLFQSGGDLARAGYGFNPFDPRPDPRNGLDDGRPALATGGSSSGPAIAVSANLAMVGVGTETSGSILSPASQNLLVGIKPTVGLVSRTGIVPITADQDTAGPLARTVTDAAVLLGAMAGHDPKDPATAACLKRGRCFSDYTKFLDRRALRGARIAVPHFSYWTDSLGRPALSAAQKKIMTDAIAVLRAEGARVEDFREIPDQADLNAFPGCGGLPISQGCSTVLLYGFKRDLNAYLAGLGPGAPARTLAEVIAFNDRFLVDGTKAALKYGQALAIAADSLDTAAGSADTRRYLADRAKDLDICRTRGLDVLYRSFDAVLFPSNRGANIAARAGYPSVVVPGGFVDNPAASPPPFAPPTPFPEGFDARPAPYGVTFSGPAFSEPRLIGYAYAFEQATHHRQPPPSAPPLPAGQVNSQ
jgi:amidase